MPTLKMAIVCTVRNPAASFKTWINYHSKLVDKIYLYLDSSTPAILSGLPTSPVVSVCPGAWLSTFSGPSGVMQRQCVNVRHGLKQCSIDGIDWLIHIDSDELMYSPVQSLKDYFAHVDPNVSSIQFINHEAVSAYAADDPFRELKIFKKNRRFDRSTDTPLAEGSPYYQGYTFGKSAVRVQKCLGPVSVHEFETSNGKMVREHQVCVLHYLSATYKDWIKKCSELGSFQSFWYDDVKSPMHQSFLVQSRDIYLSAMQSGDWSLAREFYVNNLMSDTEKEKWLQSGELLFIDPFAMRSQ
ncbi:glycosyltransferase family 2 protein [Actimicrobium sp. CCC2.4]|uniref:glycosyltransferase family 2 protein n=1 Tax=Actimicrobium sp. CCC2.4 TaxID=3048606 RepID=UPI002AC9AEDB|nr:glycosyltransferase family 2 protein [Actimicrobium sp. CCC2.4]MEB0136757.1 glycosyltransferase family 2 protein [Actimicrobium sp. CCC2.4]WPX33218.1 glycosyltransferase family 2 protein [Actimicrobium sp. CCC2.4]